MNSRISFVLLITTASFYWKRTIGNGGKISSVPMLLLPVVVLIVGVTAWHDSYKINNVFRQQLHRNIPNVLNNSNNNNKLFRQPWLQTYNSLVVSSQQQNAQCKATFLLNARGGGTSVDTEPTIETDASSSLESAASSNDKMFHFDINWGTNNNDEDDTRTNTNNLTLPTQAIIVMDGFCSYHGEYIRQSIYYDYPNVIVINVCSAYVTAILADNNSMELSDIPQIPTTSLQAEQWKELLYQIVLQKYMERRQQIDNNSDNDYYVTTLLDQLRSNFRIRAVYCESDSGLEDAELIRDLLNVDYTDIPTISPGRRNKYIMHNTITNYISQLQQQQQEQQYVTVPHQQLCTKVPEAIEFAEQNYFVKNKKVVVKPIRGVASESVFLCSTIQEVEDAFYNITSSTVFGSLQQSTTPDNETSNKGKDFAITDGSSTNPVPEQTNKHKSVLIQEYVEGTEYAIDVVSYRGIHKIAAIWKYDKRPVPGTNNGGAFCYYQTKLIDQQSTTNSGNDDVVLSLYHAVQQTLNALGIQYGLTHNEFIIRNHSPNTNDNDTDDADTTVPIPVNNLPVLIEVNCRQHNMDFCPLTMACIGYNAFDMLLDAYLTSKDGTNDSNDKDSTTAITNFNSKYPDIPTLRAHGCMVHLVNYKTGILQSVQFMDEIQNLDSVYNMEIYDTFTTPGSCIQPTKDIRTDAGWIQLINPNPIDLQSDYEAIINRYMPHMFVVS